MSAYLIVGNLEAHDWRGETRVMVEDDPLPLAIFYGAWRAGNAQDFMTAYRARQERMDRAEAEPTGDRHEDWDLDGPAHVRETPQPTDWSER